MMWAFRGFHGYSVLVPCIFFDPRSNKMECTRVLLLIDKCSKDTQTRYCGTPPYSQPCYCKTPCIFFYENSVNTANVQILKFQPI